MATQSLASVSPGQWSQVQRVRAHLSGHGWRQVFSGPVPVPSWLVDAVDGHMGGYVGPDPVLFRTAGIGTEWFLLADDHPEHLQITDAHQNLEVEGFRVAADVLAGEGALVDTDAYVYGDGAADGRFQVRMHRLFGVFPGDVSTDDLSAALSDVDGQFHQLVSHSRVGATVQLTPRLVPFSAIGGM